MWASVPADRPRHRTDTCTVDQRPERAHLQSYGHRGADVVFASDIGANESITSPASSLRSATTTLAPASASLRAVAAPKPDAPPVTMAEVFAKSMDSPIG